MHNSLFNIDDEVFHLIRFSCFMENTFLFRTLVMEVLISIVQEIDFNVDCGSSQVTDITNYFPFPCGINCLLFIGKKNRVKHFLLIEYYKKPDGIGGLLFEIDGNE